MRVFVCVYVCVCVFVCVCVSTGVYVDVLGWLLMCGYLGDRQCTFERVRGKRGVECEM